MDIQKKKISELQNWDKNPRQITKKDFERLKKQIQKLQSYKPLLINQDNIVLGGNMRLRALQDIGVNEIECSIVETKNESEMMEYALSDNDNAGTTDTDILANLLPEIDIDLETYAVHLESPQLLVDVLSTGDYTEKNKEININNLKNESNLVFKFEHKIYLNVLDLLNNAKEKLGCETDEETLLKLLSDYE